MTLKLYNTLTRRKELFKPLRKDRVGLYACGPTVYSYAHIGNLRTYIFEDVLRRTMEYAGYRVRHVMNITDVEDKIIRDARKAGVDIYTFTAPYQRVFFDDLAKLNILRAGEYPKATAHIPEMIKTISTLLKRGLAYESNGSIYFDISKFKSYGKMSRLKMRSLKAGARVDNDEYAKDSAQDFVLWKAAKADEPSWEAPFGAGRPGWHIECSAMSMQYLGPTLDIHAGGVDLIFPHHENEIAQSEGATGKPFARFFTEGEHLLINRKKMSKSLGNMFTLRDIEAKNINPLAFRYLALTAHYRSKLNFTWQSLAAAQRSLDRLYDFISTVQLRRLPRLSLHTNYGGLASVVKFTSVFDRAIADDLNTPKALAVLWDLIKQCNKNPGRYNPKAVRAALYNFDRVLGLGLKNIKKEKIPKKVLALVKKREDLRLKKDWQGADRIRDEIARLGWAVEDPKEGMTIRLMQRPQPQ